MCIGFLSIGWILKANNTSVNLTFINYTLIDVEVYEITSDNNEVYKSTLQCGSYYNLPTQQGNRWAVKAAQNKATFLEGTVGQYSEDVNIEFKSQNTSRSVALDINNQANGAVDVFWVDNQGRENFKVTLQAGQQKNINTSNGSAWFVKAKNGEILEVFVANDQYRQAFTVEGQIASTPSDPIVDGSTKPNPNPGPGPISGPISISDMVVVSFLGRGFDAVRLDPQDLTKNSVKNGSLTMPKVFEFTPNVKDPITHIYSNNTNELKYNPKGVMGNENSKFSWSSELRWAKSASEYQKSFEHAYSGSVGVPGLASVSASASFKDVNETTNEEESIYIYKDGDYKGHTLTINMNYNHRLSAEFKNAVARLNSYPTDYRAFINKWGTHFSKDNYLGAKCSYRFKVTKSSIFSKHESIKGFEQGVEATFGKIEGSLGASQKDEEMSSVKKEMGAEELTFISFGGSGDTEYPQWFRAAQSNRTLVDVRLTSYLDLLNPRWFPNDSRINEKRTNLQKALQAYYKENEFVETANPLQNQNKPRTFTARITKIYSEKGNNTEERRYGGILKLGFYNKLKRDIGNTTFMNLNGGAWLDWGQWKGNFFTLRQGKSTTKYNQTLTKTFSSNDFIGGFVTITGNMDHVWTWGTDAGKDAMSSRTEHDEFGILRINELKVGETEQSSVTFGPGKAQDILRIHFEVTRTN